MKRSLVFASFLVGVFMLSLLSAGWFSSTGNVIKDNTFVNDSSFIACDDSDNGVFSEISGAVTTRNWIGLKRVYEDKCYSHDKKLVEYYCNSHGKKAYKRINCPAGCDNGACIIPSPSCEEKAGGRVVDEQGNVFSSGCYTDEGKRSSKGMNYKEYSCNGTEVVVTETVCNTRCSPTKGCWGDCQEISDPENNKDVPGEVILDGVSFKDVCSESGLSVKQFACGTGSRRGYKKTIDWKKCGTNRECVTNADGIGYCKDKFVSSDSGETITTTLETLQTAIDSLTQQITELEARITALESA